MEIRTLEDKQAGTFRLYDNNNFLGLLYYKSEGSNINLPTRINWPTRAEAECLAEKISLLLSIENDLTEWLKTGGYLRDTEEPPLFTKRMLYVADAIRAAEKKAEGPKYFTVPIRGVAAMPPPESYRSAIVNHSMTVDDLKENKYAIDAALEAAKKKLEE